MFLTIGAWISGVAGVGLVALWRFRVVPLLKLTTPVLSIILASLPQLTIVGYDGQILDGLGKIAGLILLALHAGLMVYSAIWYWRRAAEPVVRADAPRSSMKGPGA